MRVYINIYNHSRFICLDLNSYIHTNRFIYLLILSFFLTFIIFKKKSSRDDSFCQPINSASILSIGSKKYLASYK